MQQLAFCWNWWDDSWVQLETPSNTGIASWDHMRGVSCLRVPKLPGILKPTLNILESLEKSWNLVLNRKILLDRGIVFCKIVALWFPINESILWPSFGWKSIFSCFLVLWQNFSLGMVYFWERGNWRSRKLRNILEFCERLRVGALPETSNVTHLATKFNVIDSDLVLVLCTRKSMKVILSGSVLARTR